MTCSRDGYHHDEGCGSSMNSESHSSAAYLSFKYATPDWVRRSLSARRTSYMFSDRGVIIFRFLIFRADRDTAEGMSSSVNSSACSVVESTPHLLSVLLKSLVLGVDIGALSRFSITTEFTAALWNAVLMASWFSFLLILMVQSHGLGPKMTPPPGRRGVLTEPSLARPVPFCLYGFRPPPLTSARVKVLAVPRLLFCNWVMTLLCTTAFAVSGLASLKFKVTSPVVSPWKLRLGRAVATMDTLWLPLSTAASLIEQELLRLERHELARKPWNVAMPDTPMAEFAAMAELGSSYPPLISDDHWKRGAMRGLLSEDFWPIYFSSCP